MSSWDLRLANITAQVPATHLLATMQGEIIPQVFSIHFLEVLPGQKIMDSVIHSLVQAPDSQIPQAAVILSLVLQRE